MRSPKGRARWYWLAGAGLAVTLVVAGVVLTTKKPAAPPVAAPQAAHQLSVESISRIESANLPARVEAKSPQSVRIEIVVIPGSPLDPFEDRLFIYNCKRIDNEWVIMKLFPDPIAPGKYSAYTDQYLSKRPTWDRGVSKETWDLARLKQEGLCAALIKFPSIDKTFRQMVTSNTVNITTYIGVFR